MPTYNIGPCGCCGTGCPVSWRFTSFYLRFQYITVGAQTRTNIFQAAGSDPQIELTYADQSTEIVTPTFTFVGSYETRVNGTTGTVSWNGCSATWEGTWPIGANVYDYEATQANGTFTYGQLTGGN